MATTRVPQATKSSSGLAARISLGKVFQPVSTEFVIIAATSVFLTGFGLIMVLSATSAAGDGVSPFDTFIKQAIFAIVGVPLMFVLSRFTPRFFKAIAWPLLILAVGAQMLVFSPLGFEDSGNRNWISIGGFQAQPSEFLKVSLAIWLGFMIAKKQVLLGQFWHLVLPIVPVSLLVLGTVLAGEDMGTALILGGLLFAALYMGGVKLRFLIPAALAAGVAIVALVTSSENRMLRFTSFLSDCTIDNQWCYQPLHGMWALANGGFFGVGLGNSVEKYGWLPAQGNDFIFAIIGEELGLIGCVFVLILLGLFAYAGINVARRTDDIFVRVVAGSITVWLVGQALVNIAVVLRLAPALGVPLPFLSQGGTALFSTLLACGVLLAMARTLPPKRPVTPHTVATK